MKDASEIWRPWWTSAEWYDVRPFLGHGPRGHREQALYVNGERCGVALSFVDEAVGEFEATL